MTSKHRCVLKQPRRCSEIDVSQAWSIPIGDHLLSYKLVYSRCSSCMVGNLSLRSISAPQRHHLGKLLDGRIQFPRQNVDRRPPWVYPLCTVERLLIKGVVPWSRLLIVSSVADASNYGQYTESRRGKACWHSRAIALRS